MFSFQDDGLTQDGLKATYESIRRCQPLPDHPLYRWVLMQQNLSAPHALRDRRYRQYLLEDLLIAELTTVFDNLRHHLNLHAAQTVSSLEMALTDIAAIGRQGGPLLIGYTYLYYRYIRVEFDLSTALLTKTLQQHERTLRRYVDTAWQHLYHTLLRHEHAARERSQRLRCESALPHFDVVTLAEQQYVVDHAVRALRQAQIGTLFVLGPKGSGKTSLMYQISYQLIAHQMVEDVTWLNLRQFSTIPHTSEELARLILMARYISVSSGRHPVTMLAAHLDYLSRHNQRLLLILDNLENWEIALHDLWSVLSHLTLLGAHPHHHSLLPSNNYLATPRLGLNSCQTLLRHWDRLHGNVRSIEVDTAVSILHRIADGNPRCLHRAYRLLIALAHQTKSK